MGRHGIEGRRGGRYIALQAGGLVRGVRLRGFRHECERDTLNMLKKTLGAAVFAACFGVMGAAQAASSAAYILGDGSVGAGKATVTLDGVLYQVSFNKTIQPGILCTPMVTPNVGQFAVGSARVVNANPLQVNVILMDGAGNGITGPDFYLTVNCARVR
jgi:hypothetical protein